MPVTYKDLHLDCAAARSQAPRVLSPPRANLPSRASARAVTDRQRSALFLPNLLGLLALCAHLAAADGGPADEDIAWGPLDREGVYLGLAVDRTTLAAGQELGVDVVIENRGEEDRVIPRFDADNVVVFLDRVEVRAGEGEEFAQETLAAGRRRRFGVVLPLPDPGTVTVRAALRAVVEGREIAWLRAAPVTVTVRAAAAERAAE